MQISVISDSTIQSLLSSRGIDLSGMSADELRAFWEPSITDLHDPFLFPRMELSVERILTARERGERVVIFGDYDVDGVSSTAMLMRFFTQIGIAVSYRIPHRSHDGYGMKPYFFDELASK
jgi:single-stranded-DNA-specific exonuclease